MTRTRTITWHDPADLRRRIGSLSGLETMHAIASGLLPPPPVAELIGFEPALVMPGQAVFAYSPREEHYNPLGSVHGGIVTTVLDTAMGCAVHTLLDGEVGYTTLELKANFVRPVTLASGPLRAVGTVVHAGGTVITAEARLVDADDHLYAHATSTCLVLGAERAKEQPVAA